MNNTQKIVTRHFLALFSSILILLNSLLVACGPNQSLPQLMKSSLMSDVSDGADGSSSDDGESSDDSSGVESGGGNESTGTVSEPEPSEPSNVGDSGSTGSNNSKDSSSGDLSGGGFERDHAKAKLNDGTEAHVFSEPSKISDNKDRDTTIDTDSERSVGSDKSVSISEDAGEPTGSRSDTMPEGSPALGNGEGLGSGSGAGGRGNDGGLGGGSSKNKETKKFPNLPAMVGNTDGIDGSMNKIVRDANALFDGSSPDLNKQIGNSVASHNNTVAAVFAGIALVAIPAVAIPTWVIVGAATVAIAAILAKSKIDWKAISTLLSGPNETRIPEIDELERLTNFSEADQPNATDTDGDGKPNVERNPDGTIKLEGHVVDQMRDRDVTPEAVADAVEKPLHVTDVKVDSKSNLRSRSWIGKEATVVINPDTGKIATTYKTGSDRRKKYENIGNKGVTK